MKRIAIVGLVVATAAVVYAAAGERLGGDALLGWFGAARRLPALRGAEMPFSYPARLWRRGIEGEVLLRIHITEVGSVDSVILERSSGSAELDEIAVNGATRLVYHPAMRGDDSVAVWAVLPIRFQRQSATAGTENGQ